MPHICTAQGHVERGRNPDGRRKVALALDADTFRQVRSRALTAGHSFAEEARILIDWGLEAETWNA